VYTSFNTLLVTLLNLLCTTSAATLNSATTAYTSTNEVPTSGQYSTGGGVLVKPNPSTSVASGVAIVTFANLSFTGVTITARGALIYNTSSCKQGGCGIRFYKRQDSNFRNVYNSVPSIYNFSSDSKNW
jgi:hypothetical protein